MKIHHHPDDATLLSYAAGALPQSLSAVVATHLAMCPRCRHEVREMEQLGGVMLEGLEGSGVVRSTQAGLAPRTMDLGDFDRAGEIAVEERVGLPGPLGRLVGLDLADIPWRRLGFGVWHYPLPLAGEAGGDLRLLKVGPGRVMPEHGHSGSELTLLLEGSYRDEIGEFRVGDVADLDDEVEHSPVSHPQTGCICLIASEGRARFKGVLARMVQPLTGM